MIQNHPSAASFKGVFSLLLTPFTANGAIDWNTYDKYVDWQLSKQPDGLFAVCGSSEMKWLSFEERLELAKRAAQRSGKIPVIATANLNPDISKHASEIAEMSETGISGIVLTPPSGMGEDQSKLGDYFASLLEGCQLPVIVYEWPHVTPYLIDPQVFGKLADLGLTGIKDTTCTLEGIQSKIQMASQSVVYQANTPFMLDAIRMGAQGIMAITTASAAGLVVDFWQKATHNHPDAEVLHQHLVYLDAILRLGYPATAKHLAVCQGIPFDLYTRWPVTLKNEALKAIEIWYNYAKRLELLY
ncbi:dihydrodipicolinate synthase family protein [Paenibacillus sp. FSL H7-0331]|uniref:dihydrodipicolinate synthase family protein n=1 Tax=Paenibacillus sp. FSL H7-0331 TaxID=1920421 RepID=UPI00096D4F53|nr:dihydrodipicolinate synthase family protein [Paenibacillus sp. FSL H7-0331]OMF08825.1 hypothetical protein BK127_28225 [Paenibacillus sp. FSL H7-0331]